MPAFEFRRPLGLALSGGGAMGAWQAGAVSAWVKAGVDFDRIWGFSAGAWNGAVYILGLLEDGAAIWNTLEAHPVLKLSPRHWPRAFCSDRPLRDILEAWIDEEQVKKRARGSLYVVSLDKEEGLPFVASFEPGGRWDSPLIEHLLSSAAIPWIWPPVRVQAGGRLRLLIDGGIPGRRGLDLAPLADCKDILAISVVRPNDLGAWPRGPLSWLHLHAERIVHRQMESARLSAGGPERRLFALTPSRPLGHFLDFSGPSCRDAFRLGLEDGARFLEAPSPWAPAEAPYA